MKSNCSMITTSMAISETQSSLLHKIRSNIDSPLVGIVTKCLRPWVSNSSEKRVALCRVLPLVTSGMLKTPNTIMGMSQEQKSLIAFASWLLPIESNMGLYRHQWPCIGLKNAQRHILATHSSSSQIPWISNCKKGNALLKEGYRRLFLKVLSHRTPRYWLAATPSKGFSSLWEVSHVSVNRTISNFFSHMYKTRKLLFFTTDLMLASRNKR